MPDHAEEDELTLIENAPPSRPDARLGVPATAALLVADVVGTGVLALPRNVRAVGLPFGLAFLVAQVPLNQLAGAMLDRAAASAEAGGAPLADYRELSVALAGRGSALARATALGRRWHGGMARAVRRVRATLGGLGGRRGRGPRRAAVPAVAGVGRMAPLRPAAGRAACREAPRSQARAVALASRQAPAAFRRALRGRRWRRSA